jgi:hypothetical protein
MNVDSDGEQDVGYLALPNTLKQLIDATFDSILSTEVDPDSHDGPPYKKRRIADPQSKTVTPNPGGFLVKKQLVDPGGYLIDDAPEPGGYLPASPSSPTPDSQPSPQRTQIPLSLIPAALARLNLAPDDYDTLEVFYNAAFGWSSSRQASLQVQSEGAVSKKDFRSICAVLLDSNPPLSPTSHSSISAISIEGGEGFVIEAEAGGGGFISTTSSAAAPDPSISRNPDFTPDDSGDESDIYQDPESDSEDDGSANEYFECCHPRPSSQRSKSTKIPHRAWSSDDGSFHKPKPLSSRQKKVSRTAFGLFFPDVADDKLDEQRIMIKDIVRVAGLLKEKIKTEEVCVYPALLSLISCLALLIHTSFPIDYRNARHILLITRRFNVPRRFRANDGCHWDGLNDNI